jgi:sugar diacid utilization regulator
MALAGRPLVETSTTWRISLYKTAKDNEMASTERPLARARYRIRRIETLTGRSLQNARDRIDFWLALRGRELLQDGVPA